jgi:hypothetical protein
MGAHYGMDADRFAPVGVLAHLGRSLRIHRGLWTGDHAVRVYGAQAFECALQSIGQGFIRKILVGEQRVPAVGRHVDGVENSAHRWLRDHGGVGVPAFADNLLVAGFASDIDDLGVGADTVVVGVDEDLAEAPGERLVPVDAELLVAKEDYAVVEERLTDLTDRCIVKVLRDINTADFGPQCAGDRGYFYVTVAHGRILLQRTLSVAESRVKSAGKLDGTERSAAAKWLTCSRLVPPDGYRAAIRNAGPRTLGRHEDAGCCGDCLSLASSL